MQNRYPGDCRHCNQPVAAYAGTCDKIGGTWQVAHVDDVACQQAAIDAMLGLADTSGPVAEPGMYQSPDGTFYKVQLSGTGRLYAKRVDVHEHDGEHHVEFIYEAGAVLRLTASMKLTSDQAKAFGMLYGTCCWCGISLSDERSVAAGYGPTCAKRNGWPYPTKAEAAAILADTQTIAAAAA